MKLLSKITISALIVSSLSFANDKGDGITSDLNEYTSARENGFELAFTTFPEDLFQQLNDKGDGGDIIYCTADGEKYPHGGYYFLDYVVDSKNVFWHIPGDTQTEALDNIQKLFRPDGLFGQAYPGIFFLSHLNLMIYISQFELFTNESRHSTIRAVSRTTERNSPFNLTINDINPTEGLEDNEIIPGNCDIDKIQQAALHLYNSFDFEAYLDRRNQPNYQLPSNYEERNTFGNHFYLFIEESSREISLTDDLNGNFLQQHIRNVHEMLWMLFPSDPATLRRFVALVHNSELYEDNITPERARELLHEYDLNLDSIRHY